jgi:guanosine-3',5'-bis(diphosphate) 3'-pyrophosphohydrolase
MPVQISPVVNIKKNMKKEILVKKIEEGFKDKDYFNHLLSILEKEIRDEFLLLHSLRTGLILKDWGETEDLIISGIFHHLSEENLKRVFEGNENVLLILKKFRQLEEICSVGEKLKLRNIKEWRSFLLDKRMENLRRMLFIISKEISPLLLLLANRLDEARNLSHFSKEERRNKGIEILEIFSPLAYGLGMGKIKGELEDLVFPYLYPKEYKWLVENVEEKYRERKKYAERVQPIIYQLLKEEGINVIKIDSRAKHYFSLYQKLLRKEKNIDEIYDLVALRVIVEDVESCYKTLGVIHKHYPPIEGLIDDYIANPKPNGYQSLHTTVFCEEGKKIEIQIRTLKMHEIVEYGPASHLLMYKQEIDPKILQRRKLDWLDEIRKLKEEKNFQKLADDLSFDLFQDQVFVFTPKGDVINLPKGSTPVDFAYAIHTAIGDYCAGAKVNGRMVSLKEPLKTGDTVEILLDKNRTPSYDWLKFVKTKKAVSKIKDFFQKVYGAPLKPQKSILKERIPILKKIIPEKKKKKGERVIVGGVSEVSVKISKCCSPKPGDKISAFITKGYGASLHKVECENLKELQKKWPQRIVEARWESF